MDGYLVRLLKMMRKIAGFFQDSYKILQNNRPFLTGVYRKTGSIRITRNLILIILLTNERATMVPKNFAVQLKKRERSINNVHLFENS